MFIRIARFGFSVSIGYAPNNSNQSKVITILDRWNLPSLALPTISSQFRRSIRLSLGYSC